MLERLLQMLSFSCKHKHMSKPFPAGMETVGRSTLDWDPVQPVTTAHYVVCLDCGKHLSYDWSEMRIVKEHRIAKEHR